MSEVQHETPSWGKARQTLQKRFGICRAPTLSMIFANVSISCFWLNEIYYTSPLLLLVRPDHAVFSVAAKKSVDTFVEIDRTLVERRCSPMKPTQSRVSPSIL